MSPRDDETRHGFEEFVVARRAALVRSAYLLTGDLHDADDLVQIALVKAVPHWPRISDNPEPYVRRILVRESVTRWRRRRWRELPQASPPDSVAQGVDVEGVELLREALDRLSPRQRAVVVLRYYEDLTERQAAHVLGISVGTVKSHAREAMGKLRDALSESVIVP